VDERYVPQDSPQSNFKLANDTWLQPAGFPSANIHAVNTRLPKEESTGRYGQDIRECFGLRAGEMPRFDVIHLGMGPDCHTASLFPGEPLIDDRNGLTAAVWVEKMNQWRITLLPGVLQSARHTAMLITGSDKAEALQSVLYGTLDPRSYPAQIVVREGGETTLFVDQAAARLLR
jgi:6-phosphogluconolactonase